VERVCGEFKIIKEVLRNNSIPVTADDLENSTDKLRAEAIRKMYAKNVTGTNSQYMGGSRRLFDKKVFMCLLQEVEQMRRLKQIKKRFFIFH